MTEQQHLGSVSTEERDKFYEDGPCVPTTCDRALGLPRVRWIREEDQKRPFKRVLELGCHDGFSTRWLLNSAHLDVLVGVELCKEAYDHAMRLKEEKAFPELGHYIHGSIFDLDRELAIELDNIEIDSLDAGFDVVVVFELIEHFQPDESRELLRTSHKHLAPGGRCFLTTPHEDGPFGKSNPDPSHIHFFNEETLATWIQEETGCPAQVRNIQGILHAEWAKPREDLSASVDPLRTRSFSVSDYENIPETQELNVPLNPRTVEERLEALESVAHAPVVTFTKESISSMIAGLASQVEALRARVKELEATA